MAIPVLIVGHKNPDNDSISAAVGYAYLKNELMKRTLEQNPEAEEYEYIPARLGPLPPHLLRRRRAAEPRVQPSRGAALLYLRATEWPRTENRPRRHRRLEAIRLNRPVAPRRAAAPTFPCA